MKIFKQHLGDARQRYRECLAARNLPNGESQLNEARKRFLDRIAEVPDSEPTVSPLVLETRQRFLDRIAEGRNPEECND